ncbi:MAG: PA14 domain-containing protein, partial [Prochlorococcus sp.]
MNLTGPQADIQNQPTPTSDNTYTITIPAGESSASLALIPTDDLIAEGNEQISASLISSDLYAVGGSTGSATATLQDNDTAQVNFTIAKDANITSDNNWTSVSQIRASESDSANGNTTTIGLCLNSKPLNDVTLNLETTSFSSSDLLISDPAKPGSTPSLTFTADNWNINQALDLKAVDESSDDDDQSLLVSFSSSSKDPSYASLVPSMSVLVIDNDASKESEDLVDLNVNSDDPLATLSPASMPSLTENGGLSSEFSISLSKPTNVDTVVFLTLDESITSGNIENIRLTSTDPGNNATGLTHFSANIGSEEKISIDTDAIKETADTFGAIGLSGDFTSTWSGYLYIPETGFYNFSTALAGGTRLSIDEQIIIDKLYDADAHWTSDYIEFSAGDFAAIQIDYQSFNTPDPRLELIWERPDESGSSYLEETIPANNFRSINGHHLIIPAGETTAGFLVSSNDDLITEHEQDFGFELLAARGVQLEVVSQTSNSNGSTNLELTLGTTDRESITLPAGFVLNLGANLDTKSDTLASFTFAAEATIHRDRTTEVGGTLALTQVDASPDSVIGMVGADNTGQYQLLDAAVELGLTSQLVLNDADTSSYTAELKL